MSSTANVCWQKQKKGGLIMSNGNSNAILSLVHHNSLRLWLEELNKEAQSSQFLCAFGLRSQT